MTQDDWKWYREPLIPTHNIGVTDTGRHHLDQNLVRARIVEVDLFDNERSAHLTHNRCLCIRSHVTLPVRLSLGNKPPSIRFGINSTISKIPDANLLQKS
jgi:hypothetical protein